MNPPISDEEAVSRIKGGDPDCYEILVNRHQSRLKALARRVLRNEADAEDAVQEAHLLAWQHIGQFAGRSSFAHWVASVTFNAALTQIRRRKGIFVYVDGAGETLRSPARDPEQRMVDRTLGKALRDAAGGLPEIYRTVFHLRDEEEFTTEETGRQLGLTGNCVKTRLVRARRLVAKRLLQEPVAAGYRARCY